MATLYGAKGGGAGTSSLYSINPLTGAVTVIGPIGFAVTGLAVDPTDFTLYGYTSGNSTSNPRSLITIDPVTGVGTFVGHDAAFFPVADIGFRSDGQLYGLSPGGLVLINKTNGDCSDVGPAESNFGCAMDFDDADVLWACPRGTSNNLYTYDETVGGRTLIAALSGDPLGGGNAVAAASFSEDFSTFYAIVSSFGSGSELVTINLATGAISDRGPTLTGIDAIAWTRATVVTDDDVENETCAGAITLTGTSGTRTADNTGANSFDFATDPLFNDECWGLGYGGGGPLWWKYRNPFSRPVLLRVYLENPSTGAHITRALFGLFRGICGALTTLDVMDTQAENRTWDGYVSDSLLADVDHVDAVVAPGETVYLEVDGYSGDTTDPVTLSGVNRGRFQIRWRVLSVSVTSGLEESELESDDNCGIGGESFVEEGSSVVGALSEIYDPAPPQDYVEFSDHSWYTATVNAFGDPPPDVVDDFNRADANPLDGNWTTPFGSFATPDPMQLVSNEAAATNPAGFASAGFDTLYAGDVEIEASAQGSYSTPADLARLYVRMSADGDDGYMATFDDSGVYVLSRLDGGSETVLDIAFGFAPGPDDRIALRAEGDVITLRHLRHLEPDGHWRTVTVTDSTYPGPGYVGIGIAGTSGRLDDVRVGTENFPPDYPPAKVHRWDPSTETVKTYLLPTSGAWAQTEILLNHDGATIYAVTTENGGPDGDGWPNPSIGLGTESDEWFPAYPVAFAYDAGIDDFVRLGIMEPKAGNVYVRGAVGAFDITAHPSMPGRVYVVWSEKGFDGAGDGASNWIEHTAVGCFGPDAPFTEFDIGFSTTATASATSGVGKTPGDPHGDPPHYIPRVGYALLANDQEVCQLFRIEPQTMVDLDPGAPIIVGPYFKDEVLCEQVEDAGSLTLKQTITYESPPGSGTSATLGNAGFADGISLEPECHTETALDSAIVWGFIRQGDAFPGDRPDWTTLPALGVTGALWLDTDPTFTLADLTATRTAGFKAGMWTNAGSGQSAASFVTQVSDLIDDFAPDLVVLDVETRYGTDPSANWTWHEDVMSALAAAYPDQPFAATMGPLHDDFNYDAYASRDVELWPQSYPGDLADCVDFPPVDIFDRVVANGVAPALVAPVLAAPCYQAHVSELAAAGHSRWSVFTLDDRPRAPSSGTSATETEPLRTVIIAWRLQSYPLGSPPLAFANYAYNVAPLLDAPERWYNDNAQGNGNDVFVGLGGPSITARSVRRTLYRDRFAETWGLIEGQRTAVFFDRSCTRTWETVPLPYQDIAVNAFTPNQRMLPARQVHWTEADDVIRTVTAYEIQGDDVFDLNYLAVGHIQVLRRWVPCEIGEEVEDTLGSPIIVARFAGGLSTATPAAISETGVTLDRVIFVAAASDEAAASLSADADVHLSGVRFRV